MEKPNKKLADSFIVEFKPLIDQTLETNIQDATSVKLLTSSMEYSLMAGGKRLRPLLTLATLNTLGMRKEELNNAELIKLVSAIELVHTYSLIHDDLPSMDNSDYRRGKLTNHKKYGDDIATLAGDGLLTLAFEWIADSDLILDDLKVKLIYQLAKAAGPAGMVGGQTIDVSSSREKLNLAQLQELDNKKTGDLFFFAVDAALIITDATPLQSKPLKDYAKSFGLAFQIFDDLKDDSSHGTTEDDNKNTYVNLVGEKGAKDRMSEAIEDAQDSLSAIPSPELLNSFLAYFNE